jgi:hypothetical protein
MINYEEDEIELTCSTHGRDDKYIEIFGSKT